MRHHGLVHCGRSMITRNCTVREIIIRSDHRALESQPLAWNSRTVSHHFFQPAANGGAKLRRPVLLGSRKTYHRQANHSASGAAMIAPRPAARRISRQLQSRPGRWASPASRLVSRPNPAMPSTHAEVHRRPCSARTTPQAISSRLGPSIRASLTLCVRPHANIVPAHRTRLSGPVGGNHRSSSQASNSHATRFCTAYACSTRSGRPRPNT